MRRVTRDNGILYITFQNEATWKQVPERPGCIEQFANANKFAGNPKITRSLFDEPMPQDRIVLRMSDNPVYHCNVWMTNDYVRENWGRFFNIVKIADRAHSSFQSVVVLQPR